MFFPRGFKAPSAERCSNAMGMENFTIPNSAISVSSIVNGQFEGYEARLNAWHGKNGLKGAGWKAGSNNMNQWLQVCYQLALGPVARKWVKFN